MRRALCLLGSLAGFGEGISLQFGGSDFPSLPDAKEFNTGDLAIEKFLVQMDMAILTESKKEGQVCVCVREEALGELELKGRHGEARSTVLQNKSLAHLKPEQRGGFTAINPQRRSPAQRSRPYIEACSIEAFSI